MTRDARATACAATATTMACTATSGNSTVCRTERCTIQRHGESKAQSEECRLEEGGRRGGGSTGRLGEELETGVQTARDGGRRRRWECREGGVTGGVVGVLIDPNRLSGGRRYYYMVSSYYYGCVLILLHMRPHTTMYVSSNSYVFVLILLCVLILQYRCPHGTLCVHIRLDVS
jgi:hypothetical protein